MALLDNHNLGPFLFTFLPALIYAMVIYSYTECKVNIKKVIAYFTMGTCGVFIAADLVPFIFPNWRQQVSGDAVVSLFVFAMVQVAMLEELIKFSLFKTMNMLVEEKFDPLATLFYCVCASCGFAVAENLIYATMFGTNVLLIRAFTAIPMHIIFGIIMGYFISLGRMKSANLSLIRKSATRIGYTAIGIAAASMVHGTYDFVGFQHNQSMDRIWWIVLFSAAGAYSLLNDLILKAKNL